MNGLDGGTDTRFGQRREPTRCIASFLLQVNAQYLHQHDVAQVLDHQGAARGWGGEFVRQPLQGPAQYGCLIRLALDHRDRWQAVEQKLGFVAKGETPADQKAIFITAAVRHAVNGVRVDRLGSDRWQRKIAANQEGAPTG